LRLSELAWHCEGRRVTNNTTIKLAIAKKVLTKKDDPIKAEKGRVINMRNIECITLPRSGHHLLVNYLLKYFSNNLRYPETNGLGNKDVYKSVLSAGTFNYCEHYNHCRSIPCPDTRVNFKKLHDSHNEVKNYRSKHYIIQYRHPFEWLVAFFEYKIMNQGSKNIYDHHQKDWFEFISKHEDSDKNGPLMPYPSKIQYWKGFVNKWIIYNDNPNAYVLLYSDFIKNPVLKLEEIIRFIEPENPVDTGMIERVVNILSVKEARDITKFRFYNASLFKKLEESMLKEIESLSLYRYFR